MKFKGSKTASGFETFQAGDSTQSLSLVVLIIQYVDQPFILNYSISRNNRQNRYFKICRKWIDELFMELLVVAFLTCLVLLENGTCVFSGKLKPFWFDEMSSSRFSFLNYTESRTYPGYVNPLKKQDFEESFQNHYRQEHLNKLY